jgi:hypothetical protein
MHFVNDIPHALTVKHIRMKASYIKNCSSITSFKCAVSSAVGWGTAVQVGRSRVRFPLVSLSFFINTILLAALWPGVNSACNRKEYQEYFLGGKGGRCIGLTTLPPSWAFMKSGRLNFLEPSEPVQELRDLHLLQDNLKIVTDQY